MPEVEHITPYGSHGDAREKREQVRDMFDNIAHSYDFMNRMMTLGIDKSWRKKCVSMAAETSPRDILDLASGTGDLAIAMSLKLPEAKITGADLSEGMLEIGRKKALEHGVESRVEFVTADALDLPFEDNSFNVVTIAFGVRNFQNLKKGYDEIFRVLKPGGRVLVLELTQPASKAVKPFYNIYTRGIIPLIGRMISKDAEAYSYLPHSITAVPARDRMTELMGNAGFRDATWENLTLGVANIYSAFK